MNLTIINIIYELDYYIYSTYFTPLTKLAFEMRKGV